MFNRSLTAGLLIALLGSVATSHAHDRVSPEPDQPHSVSPPDLRRGHWVFSVGGGVATPSIDLVPANLELGQLTVGPSLRGRIGWGLNRHLMMTVDGGLAHMSGQLSCDGCSATTYDIGGGLAYHISQGFAFDPWVAYSVGYRHSVINLTGQPSSYSGIDFARLTLGGDYYPLPSLGFGPFLELNLGMRDQSNTTVYSLFHAGLQVTFDPMRTGTRLSPSIAER